MTRAQQILWAVVIVVVLIGLYLWWSSAQPQTTSQNNVVVTNTGTSQQTQPQTATSSTQSDNSGTNVNASGSITATVKTVPTSATVTFNGSGFSPSNVKIAQGGTVTWRSTAGPIWIASNPHPIHNGYDGTSVQQHCAANYTGPAPFDQCASGTSFSFTFNKVGTWGYHDHLDTGVMGSVTVIAQ